MNCKAKDPITDYWLTTHSCTKNSNSLESQRECYCLFHNNTHTHPFNGPLSRTTRVSRYQKGKPIWILLKQEIVSGSAISWAICKSASRSREITTPAPHHSVFLQAGCPSCRPTNSVKAVKAQCFIRKRISKLYLE